MRSILAFITVSLCLAICSGLPPAQAAVFSLSPSEGNSYLGVRFGVKIVLDTHGQDIVVADAILTYDPSALRVDGITPNYADPPSDGQFQFLAQNLYGNGRVQVVVGRPKPGLNGDGIQVAEVYFTALRPENSAAVSYYFLSAGASGDSNAVLYSESGTDILNGVSGGAYAVRPRVIVESSDYQGDAAEEFAVFRGSSGFWAVRGVTAFYLGLNGDLPAPADYNGDGRTEAALFRASSGLWALKTGARYYFGGTGDIPVPGDYNGDGQSDIALFRPVSGLWAIRNFTRVYYGLSGDYPVPADYDRDGKCDIAVYRPAAGLWSVRNVSRVYFGSSEDVPVPADFGGDGGVGIGVFRPSGGQWAVRGLTRAVFGTSGDIPFVHRSAAGGADKLGVFRSAGGSWMIRQHTSFYYGQAGDIPLSR